MGIFFISISKAVTDNRIAKVSVPYGDLFYFYMMIENDNDFNNGFRPLWGSFLFLYILWKPYRA